MKLSIRNKISVLTGAIIIILGLSLSLSSVTTMKKVISEERMNDFSERIRIIIDELNVTAEELEETGLTEFFEKDFQNDVLEILRKRYYIKENNSIKFFPYILDENGNVLIHPEQETGSEIFAGTDFIQEAFNMKNGYLEYESNGEKYWMVYQLFEKWNWLIIYSCKISDKYEDVADFRTTIIFLGILLGSVGIGLMYIVMFKLLKPLEKSTIMLKDISEGEGDLTGRLTIKSHDEIGKMAEYFNSFISKLNIMISSIKSISGKNLSIKNDLNSSTEIVSSSLIQITENVKDIQGQIKKLDNNVLNSSSHVDNISGNIASLDNLIEEQVAMVEESTASVTQMIASLNNVASITEKKKVSTDRLVETSKDGEEKLDVFIQVVEEINHTIDTIFEMTGIISGIAAQTNLLSMNAAIEAAHAGDAGRGFAVVADEIRKLAETSSENSGEISKALKTIVDKIKSASSSSQVTRTAFDDIKCEINDVALALSEISSSTAELQVGGNEILIAMNKLQSVSENVKKGSDEMSGGSNHVANSVMTTKEISGDVTSAIEIIFTGIEDIINEMKHVSERSAALGTAADNLAAEVNKFKT